MKTSDIYDRYKELCNDDNFICSQSELQDFILCGLIIEAGKGKYILRNTDIKKISVLKDLNLDFDIDLSSLISIDLKEYETNKVYYMSKDTYNRYKEHNLIVNKKGNDYYRFFADELWLVKIL